jgi:hypothetical protein
MTDHKKPGVAFWASVVVVAVLVGYPLSFGPACWLNFRTGIGNEALTTIYRPAFILWMTEGSAGRLVRSYAFYGAPPGAKIMVEQTEVGFQIQSHQ